MVKIAGLSEGFGALLSPALNPQRSQQYLNRSLAIKNEEMSLGFLRTIMFSMNPKKALSDSTRYSVEEKRE